MKRCILTVFVLLCAAASQAQNGDAYFEQGELLYNRGNYGGALKSFQQAVDADSKDAEAYYYMGNIYRRQGKYSMAVGAFQKAIQIYPEFARAYNNMGDAYDDMANYQQAIRAYQRAVQLKPDFVEAYCNLACVYEEKGDYQSAIASFEKALKIDPNYGYAKYGLYAVRMRGQGANVQSPAPEPDYSFQMQPSGSGQPARRSAPPQERTDRVRAEQVRADSLNRAARTTLKKDSVNSEPVLKSKSEKVKLGRRTFQSGLVSPVNVGKENGRIVVDIVVNPQGNVTSASIGKGTTIINAETLNIAREAASKAKFNAIKGKKDQKGKITYEYASPTAVDKKTAKKAKKEKNGKKDKDGDKDPLID